MAPHSSDIAPDLSGVPLLAPLRPLADERIAAGWLALITVGSGGPGAHGERLAAPSAGRPAALSRRPGIDGFGTGR